MDEEAHLNYRAWLSKVLRGQRPTEPICGPESVGALLDAADIEGVLSLLDHRLKAMPDADLPTGFAEALSLRVRDKAAMGLFWQAECRAILECLEEAGIASLLLKGSALAWWAYRQPYLRECGDIDLLLPSVEAASGALDALGELGYSAPIRPRPGGLVNFETCCSRGQGAARREVDLHWQLSSTPLFAFRFDWQELASQAMPLVALSKGARGLEPVHALLHACMHRVQSLAQGQPDRLKWLYDLWLLGHKLDDSDWQRCTREAMDRGLASVCLDSLQAAQVCFGAFVPDSVCEACSQAAGKQALDVSRLADWRYFQRATWRAFDRPSQRWRWLAQRLFPDAAYLQSRHGSAGGLVGQLRRRSAAAWRRLRS